MKRCVAVVVTLSLFLSPLSWAGKAVKAEYNGTPRLSDYVLPIEAIEKMTPENKIGYFVFLYHYISFFEHAQKKNVMKDNQASAAFDFFKSLEFNLPEDFSLLPRAYAVAPLVPLAAGAVARVAPVAIRLYPIYSRGIVTYGSKAASWASRAWSATKTAAKGGTLVYTGYEIRKAVEPREKPTPTLALKSGSAAAKPTVTVTPVAKTDVPAKSRSGNGRRAATAGGGGATATSAAAGGDEAPIAGYKAEGSACIYGGHNSKYISKGDYLTCERPADRVNTEGCANSQPPTYKCETFGMLAGPKAEDNISTGCVSLKPVVDLTVRCAQKLSDWLKSSPPPLLDKNAYTAWRAEVIKNINEFEANFGNGVKFSDYCKDGNKLNEGRQVNECQALAELFSQVNKLTPPVAQVIAANASPTTAPTAASTPTTAPAAKPAPPAKSAR
ncbi:MAG: hypothetical protein AABZ31_00805 [Bdellovibrionota bacterium]